MSGAVTLPHSVLVVAEIGINHNGDLELAHEQIRAAKAAGADAVKFQNYRTEDFLSDESLTYTYVSQGQKITESQWAMFKRCELAPTALQTLKAWCDEEGLLFGSTPTNAKGVEELARLGAAFVKNGSDFLGHLPLIRAMAQSGLPTVLSTGMATGEEIQSACDAYFQAGGKHLTLLVCTSAYPTPAEHAHLSRIPAFARRWGVPVGFSDHTRGTLAAAVAVALGAVFIEKHFTTSKNLPGPDHEFSSDPGEFAQLVRAVRETEKLLGLPEIRPSEAEETARQLYRLSCHAARTLEAGEILRSEDVVFRRPGTGLSPAQAESFYGKKLGRRVLAGARISKEDFVA